MTYELRNKELDTIVLSEESINEYISNNKFETNKISDGYHTFGELYKHRTLLFITLNKFIDFYSLEYSNGSDYTEFSNLKSKKHFDGSEFEGWFIVQLETPKGQISYHLPNEYWDKCNFIPTHEKANEYDGHNSNDILERLLSLITCY